MTQKPSPKPRAQGRSTAKKTGSTKSRAAASKVQAATTKGVKKPPPPSGFVCRLGSMLLERKHAEGSVREIERKIEEANKNIRNPEGFVDRRKLGALIDGRLDVHFSLTELLAISAYLEQCGVVGLADIPLFDRSGLLRELAQTDKVTFFVGSKVVGGPKDEPGRQDMSRWDVAGCRAVEDGIHRLTNRRITDLIDVMLEPDADAARKAMTEAWTTTFSGPDSIVVIGSPRANMSAELALCDQYDAKPWTDTGRHDPPIPFHFIWPAFKVKKPAKSAFCLSLAHAKRVDATKYDQLVAGEFGVRTPGDAIELGEPPHWKDARTYGVITMQRRSNGALWLVVAGLNGVSTYASSVLLDRLILDFPVAELGKHSPVRSVMLEMKYKSDEPRSLDRVSTELKWKLLGDAIDWTPDEGIIDHIKVGIRQ